MEFRKELFDMPQEKAWCPGCGNFALHQYLQEVLAELKISPDKIVFVSGIGQAAKLPQYTRGHMFNGLHGRSLPAAMAINTANPELKIIVNSGDGCTYGEGGNHFIAQIQRNPDIVNIVHNNMVYGLTKGQASPTSLKGMITKVQQNGVSNEPFNPLTVAISLGATFVARIFPGNSVQTKRVLKEAIQHKGYALVDCFVQCVSMNKMNTFQWYKDNTYELEPSHDVTDRQQAYIRASETDMYPTGIFYKQDGKPVFWEQTSAYVNNLDPLFKRSVDLEKLNKVLDSKT